MNVLDVIPFDAANITTNVPLTETAWVAGQYNTGDRAYVEPTYDLYEAVAIPHTNDEPTAGAALDPPTWKKVGKVNRYNCFDGVLQNPTVFTGGLDMSITGGNAFKTGMAMFEVSAGAVRITGSANGEEFYDQTFSMVDTTHIKNARDWTYSPPVFKSLLALELPPVSFNSTIRIRIDGDGSIGEIAIGHMRNFGKTRWGSTREIDDYSGFEIDAFGQQNLIPRGYATSLDVPGFVPTSSLAYFQRELAKYRARPAVFIGSTAHESTIAYGTFRDIVAVHGNTISNVTLAIKGIV